jgi:uncharacterized protein
VEAEVAEPAIKQLKKLKKVVVAYSGGADSTLVTYLCKMTGIDYVAVTVNSEVLSRDELENAIRVAEILNLNHEVINVSLLDVPEFVRNDQKRCYHCKKTILTAIKSTFNGRTIVDGSNADDMNENRPGRKALQEFGVISPLKHLTKNEIRTISNELSLPTWNRPSNSCLATRVNGEEISEEKLRKIEEAENVLRNFGFKLIRVRTRGDNATVQVARNRVQDLMRIKKEISARIKKLGFQHVLFDPEGYPSEEIK